MDVRNYRAAYSRCVDLAEEWQESDDPEIVECGLTLADMLLIHDGDLEPKHAARPPHPNTMAGRKS